MNPDDQPKQSLTSLEAAALLISGGDTADPNKAAVQARTDLPDIGAETLKLDAQQRAALQQMMGFDFRIKVQPNKIHVSSKQDPYVTTYCKYDGEINEATIDKLVDACLRLKFKFEDAVRKQNAIR